MKPINVGLLGLGTVGAGTIEVLRRNKEEIARRAGREIRISHASARDLTKPRSFSLEGIELLSSADALVTHPDIDIVCELIGGLDPAKSFALRALENGKHVVTANKEMIAKEGHDLMELASAKKLDFQFEGSVAGGIPIIQPMKNGLSGNRINEVMGIINGTTNYILTKMAKDHADFDSVLAEAKAHGYAEVDPTNDIEGYDAQYKIAILSSIAFTSRVHVNEVYVEGITGASKADFIWAEELGYVIKLVGIARRVGDNGMQVRVHPTLLPKSHPLASTNDVYNAILIRGDSVGDVMFYGRGAGSGPTGSAVVGDIMDVCRNLIYGSTGRIACTCFENKTMLPFEEVNTRHYLRMRVEDKPRVLAAIASVLGEHDISIETVVQKAATEDKAEIVWVTHHALCKNVIAAIKRIEALPVVQEVSNWLIVE